MFEVAVNIVPAPLAVPHRGAEQQVFPGRHKGKHLPAFRRERSAQETIRDYYAPTNRDNAMFVRWELQRKI